jgi:hypothetical protein
MKRLFRDKKAQVRTIEAFFASILLLSFIALVPSNQEQVDSSSNALSSMALNALVSLDNDGSLTSLVDIQDWKTLEMHIQSVIPSAVWFNLTAFDANMKPLNNLAITSGSPISDNIQVASYICASTNESYAVYLLRLQVSAVD